jgi:hypothetical protein
MVPFAKSKPDTAERAFSGRLLAEQGEKKLQKEKSGLKSRNSSSGWSCWKEGGVSD